MKLSAFAYCWVLRWPWVLAVLAIAAVPAGLSGGQWQRGEDKRATLARIASWEREGAVGLARLGELTGTQGPAAMAEVDGVRLDFEARWIAPMVWLVDNRIVDRRPGYDVVIAVEDLADVRAAGSSGGAPRAVLVNLGWIAAEGGREVLPVPAIPPRLRVQGLFRTDVSGLLLGANVEDHGRWPMRIQQADPLQLAGWLAVPLAPGLIHQQQGSPFHIHYRPVVLPPERHRGYALQWGLIALAVIGVALAASARPVPAADGEIVHEQS
ncbi:MAG TPA: SURF1 family protein [Thauera aminoaromatica]|nr:SURF1 family protein [Thauera aminoaromatica]